MSDDILKVPLVDIKKVIDIRRDKLNAVKRQEYKEAQILRDEEKSIVTKYPCLPDIESDDLIVYLRDRGIDLLLN
jgi:hypothetical protein